MYAVATRTPTELAQGQNFFFEPDYLVETRAAARKIKRQLRKDKFSKMWEVKIYKVTETR